MTCNLLLAVNEDRDTHAFVSKVFCLKLEILTVIIEDWSNSFGKSSK